MTETPLYRGPPAPEHFQVETFSLKEIQNTQKFQGHLNQRHADGWKLVATLPFPVTAGAASVVYASAVIIWEKRSA